MRHLPVGEKVNSIVEAVSKWKPSVLRTQFGIIVNKVTVSFVLDFENAEKCRRSKSNDGDSKYLVTALTSSTNQTGII